MKIIRRKKDLDKFKKRLKTFSFVPTMGGLHEGHEFLIKKAQKKTKKVLVSIFINPKQFNSKNDFKFTRFTKFNDILVSDFVFLLCFCWGHTCAGLSEHFCEFFFALLWSTTNCLVCRALFEQYFLYMLNTIQSRLKGTVPCSYRRRALRVLFKLLNLLVESVSLIIVVTIKCKLVAQMSQWQHL